ncbi:iridoid synthase-like protein, partial [Tanacetum coccineum]
MPPKRTSTSEAPAMTQAAIRKLVADSVATALEAQAATMANDDNTNRNTGEREAPIARKCSYKEFMSCQPFNFQSEVGEKEEEGLILQVNIILYIDIRRRGTFTVGDDQFPASLFDLPCIVESHKTYDDSVLIKTADVGQASVTDTAKIQAFNYTNGDVFTWKMLWKVICDVFDVEFVPFDEQEEFDFADFLKDKGEVWDEIVKTNGLYNTKMEEITCFNEIQFILKNLNIQHVCSMYKSREFGFHGYADTLASIAPWVERLRQMKILP